jgi:hypothetical protein
MVSAICKACGKEMKARGGGPIEYFPFCLLRRSDGRAYADARAALKALHDLARRGGCVLKIRFGISLLTRRIQIDFGGNNGKLD